MLGTVFLIIWGHIYADFFDRSLITFIWKSIQKSPMLTDLMLWLQQSAIYRAAVYTVIDREGTLDALIHFLEAIGVVNVLFGSINEQLSSKKYGILMRDVVKTTYPNHFAIQLPVHTSFAILGIYACYKDIISAAILCTLGTLFCFVYSLNLLLCLVYFQDRKAGLVRNHIDSLTLVTETGFHPKKSEVQLIMLDYAEYLGKQWDKGVLNQVHRNEKLFTDSYLITIASRRLRLRRESFARVSDYKEQSALMPGLLWYFPGAEMHTGREANYILFSEGLYLACERDKDMQRNTSKLYEFRSDILYYGQMWDVMLGQVREKEHRITMIYTVLSEAFYNDSAVFTGMSLGLLHYLKIAWCTPIEQDNTSALTEVMVLLLGLLHVHNTNEDIENSFFLALCEIVCVACGVIQWMIILEMLPTDTKNWVDVLRDNQVAELEWRRLTKHADAFAVMSYLLVDYENRDAAAGHLPTHLLMKLYPHVSHIFN